MGKTVKSLQKSGVPSRLEDHLGYWLRYVSNHVSSRFAQRMEERGVTVSEWVALRALYDVEDASPSELAARMGMTKGAVSRLIERLLRKKMLQRSPSSRDGRAQILRITSGGRALVPQLAALADENDRDFFGSLPQSARAGLMRTMRQLVKQHRLKRLPVE